MTLRCANDYFCPSANSDDSPPSTPTSTFGAPARQSLLELPDTLVPSRRSVALTFDDSLAEPSHTQQVLNVLAAHKVRATFFITARADNTSNNGSWSAAASTCLKRMVDDDHELGHHTLSHAHLRTLTTEQITAQLDAQDRDLGQALAQPNLRLRLMRAPHIRARSSQERLFTPRAFDKLSSALAGRAVHVGWNMDAMAWQNKTADHLRLNVKDLLDASDCGGIILLHSRYLRTAEALPGIIADIRQRGYGFASCEIYARQRYGDKLRILSD